MIGEALRQLTSSKDFTVRQVHFKTGLVLHDDQDTEVITELRRINLTNTLESEWFDFSISSLHGSTWTKHCFGQARAESETRHATPIIEVQRRQVSSRTWYRAMKKYGFDYGARFLCLNDITASPLEKLATATIVNDQQEAESPWVIHPAPLDGILQIFSVAAYHGLPKNFHYASVPTYIDELYLKSANGSIHLQVIADKVPTKGSISGSLIGVSEGETVIDMRGVSLSRISESEDGSTQDAHAAVELEWKADLNFLNASTLIKGTTVRTPLHNMTDMLSLTCLLETQGRLEDRRSDVPHLQKYKTWINETAKTARAGDYPGVVNVTDITSLSPEARRDLIEEIYLNLKSTSAAAAAEAIHRVMRHSVEFLIGHTDPLSTLLADDVLHRMYDFRQDSDSSEFLELMAHQKPNMKVLEIGAGTGSFTNVILPHLKSTYDERMYFSYTYTDISPGFFPAAKERFKRYNGMEYAVLDITRDVTEQGFQLGSFDLILACNVLHATPNVRESLENVRHLLHPRGRVLFQELEPVSKWMNFVMGVLPGWWLGSDDGRPDEPYVSAQRWNRDLRSAGFDDVAITHDGYLNNNIVARLAQKQPPKRITVLCDADPAEGESEVISLFEAKGYTVHQCSIADSPPPGQDVVSLLDLARPYLHEANENDFNALIRFVLSIHDAGILWVTGAIQVECHDPRYAMILGLARNTGIEIGLDFATLELQDFDIDRLRCIPSVLSEFQLRAKDMEVDATMEWAVHNGNILTSRFHWTKLKEQLLGKHDDNCLARLEVGKPGLIDSLVWKQVEKVAVERDLVEIDVRAVGLNFKVRTRSLWQTPANYHDSNRMFSSSLASLLISMPSATV